MVTGADVEIGSHYEKVAAFKGWLRIYDDDGKTGVIRGWAADLIFGSENRTCKMSMADK